MTVHEYRGEASPDVLLEAQAEAVCEQWLSTRHGLQMYLGPPRLFEDRPGRRWFIAKHAGSVVGVLSLLRVGCFDSESLINIVFSSPAAPSHTNELLVVTALKALREEEANLVCLGVGPLKALGRIDGYNAITEFLSRGLYRLATSIMYQHGKTKFWEKFHVTRREPLYLLFQSARIDFRALNALLRAFHFSVA